MRFGLAISTGCVPLISIVLSITTWAGMQAKLLTLFMAFVPFAFMRLPKMFPITFRPMGWWRGT
jgi:hypothetical protein